MKLIQPRNDFERWVAEHFSGNNPQCVSWDLELGPGGDYINQRIRDARDGWQAAIEYVKETHDIQTGLEDN